MEQKETKDNNKQNLAEGISEEKEKLSDNSSEHEECPKCKQKEVRLNDKYIRLFADFENYKKRTLKEKMGLISSANKSLVLSILPIIDDFERAFNSSNNEVSKIDKGVSHIYEKFLEILQKIGLKAMDIKKGDDFDTEKSEAITKVKSENDSNKIVDIIEKGYLLNDKIIRFSKVIISE